MTFIHKPVLLREALEQLRIRDNALYVDGTLGGAGHATAILESNPTCKLIGIDRDAEALGASSERLAVYGDRVRVVNSNFGDIARVLDSLNVSEIDGFLLDLGVSSHQLDMPERGFSYMHEARLDMRMNTNQDFDAWELVNTYDKKSLQEIIWKNSDERWAKRIAEFIVEERRVKPINTTIDLVNVIKKAIPHGARREGGHPAKRTFQAIRIEVNEELKSITKAIEGVCPYIKTGGMIAIISFHSIEDRIVKNAFRALEGRCTCPPDFPICTCGKKATLKIIKPKGILPTEEEVADNSRAKSARLRLAQKV